MQSTIIVKLDDGRENRTDADFDPPPPLGDGWHPSEYAIHDARMLAAELIGGTDEDGEPITEDDLGVDAVTDFKPGEKWSCSFSGVILQAGKRVGTFDAETRYLHD